MEVYLCCPSEGIISVVVALPEKFAVVLALSDCIPVRPTFLMYYRCTNNLEFPLHGDKLACNRIQTRMAQFVRSVH